MSFYIIPYFLEALFISFHSFSFNLAFSFYIIELILSSAWSVQLLKLLYALRSSSAAFFSSIKLFIFFSKLVILVSISSNLFSRFLVSLLWVRTCSFSSKKFIITQLLKPVCQFIRLILHPALFPCW